MKISLTELRKIVREEVEQDYTVHLQNHKANLAATKEQVKLSTSASKILSAISDFLEKTEETDLSVKNQLSSLLPALSDIVENPSSYLGKDAPPANSSKQASLKANQKKVVKKSPDAKSEKSLNASNRRMPRK